MKQRIEKTRDGTYYPQHKFMFWWLYHYTETIYYDSNDDLQRSAKLLVSFKTEDEATAYLDKRYTDSVAKEPIAWISWNRPE